MNKKTTYAVVDIETTGTSVKDGDRIIQIGCAFVKNNQIINTFSSDVNPLTTVPEVITNLTGITNARVRKAPLFDDIAGTIFSLLSDTVFVAHNVNFDLPFINAELQRVGYPELSIDAVDTVSLSQILLPTANSFRLRDLSELLNIRHEHPHAADSDALATARLFIFLQKRLRQLPLSTLKQMQAVHAELPRETNQLFDAAFNTVQSRAPKLPDYLEIVHGLALRKKDTPQYTIRQTAAKYPRTKATKQRLFGSGLTWRPQQGRMMNQIYQHYTTPANADKALMIEAPTGTGKTLGYLLPLAYLAQSGKQVVISTATTLLQSQLAEQGMHLLNQVLPFHVTYAVVKGNQHYLDLSKFAQTLTMPEHSKQTQLLKLRLLVWLTMTTTGDLDELHLSTYQAPYFAEISHHGLATLSPKQPFYAVDFLRFRDQLVQHANFIITNHAYLARHADQLGSRQDQPYLVLDEAQHLGDRILADSRQVFDFNAYMSACHSLISQINQEHGVNLQTLFADDANATYQLAQLHQALSQTDDLLQRLQASLFREFGQLPKNKNGQVQTVLIASDQMQAFFKSQQALLRQLQTNIANCFFQFDQIQKPLENGPQRLTNAEQQRLVHFGNRLLELQHGYDLLQRWLQPTDELLRAYWLILNQWGDRGSLRLAGSLVNTQGFFSQQLYPYFMAPLLTGATLFTTGRSQYVYQQLDLDAEKTKTHRLGSPFKLDQQLALWVATDAAPAEQSNSSQRPQYLAKAITKIVKATDKKTLVLFNSLSMIEAVFGELHQTGLAASYELLGQGVNGSKEKLLRRFTQEEHAVLLGAASFWEGIDLPADQLELLIVTQLPFDSPEQILAQVAYQQIKASGQNPFMRAALPQATLKLRQGIGRLIRTETDRGAAVILDNRLVTKRYGRTMQTALPKQVPVRSGSIQAISEDLQKFFKNS